MVGRLQSVIAIDHEQLKSVAYNCIIWSGTKIEMRHNRGHVPPYFAVCLTISS